MHLDVCTLGLNENDPNEKYPKSCRIYQIGKCIGDISKIVETKEMNGGKGCDDEEGRSYDMLTWNGNPCNFIESFDDQLEHTHCAHSRFGMAITGQSVSSVYECDSSLIPSFYPYFLVILYTVQIMQSYHKRFH